MAAFPMVSFLLVLRPFSILCLIAGFAGMCPLAQAAAEPPAWWIEQGVLIPGAEADDFAAANVGQLKFVAARAAAAMEDEFAALGGAGTEITQMVAGWSAGAGDYSAVNLGQVKYVAAPFYARLAELNYIGPPLEAGRTVPWSGQNTDEHAWANLGQLKHVFSFEIQAPISSAVDSDGDGLDDSWELQYWGSLERDGKLDYDGDGFTDRMEHDSQTDPKQAQVTRSNADKVYIYDPMGRLKNVQGTYTFAYTFDHEGNIETAE